MLLSNCFRKHKIISTSCYQLLEIKHKNYTVDSEKPSVKENDHKLLSKELPGLRDFLQSQKQVTYKELKSSNVPYLSNDEMYGKQRKVFFEIYGCQMNFNDTEVIWSILNESGFIKCNNSNDADVIILITCAIREGAEQKIWNKLKHLHAMKMKRSKKSPLQVVLAGCMAERLKEQLLEKEKCVDVIAGPDSYKDLPRLLATSKHYGQAAINVILSADETYADIKPLRINSDSPTAFLSITRGCNNLCSYCIVPFTRGRERSRPNDSILNEVSHLVKNGVKEITLLGQNVNSYRDLSSNIPENQYKTSLVDGFRTIYKPKTGGIPFAELLRKIAETAPETRIRFTSPHPKDFPDEVLQVIKKYPNVCKSLHLPAQSGNSDVLHRMRRGYTREAYVELVKHIRSVLPNVSLSSDFICGFCGETETEFEDTLSLINEIKYNVAYLFAYSMREKTTAHRRYKDDVPENVKNERLERMIKIFRSTASELQSKFIGKNELVLIEGKSKRSNDYWFGRNDGNIKVIIPNKSIPIDKDCFETKNINQGDYISVLITESNSQVLKGSPLYHSSNLQEYYRTLNT